jgi:hypothetical protein
MQDDGGQQAGLYGLGGAIAGAGGVLFSLGLTLNPRSQTLQFLGLIAFVAGLAIIIRLFEVSRDAVTAGYGV